MIQKINYFLKLIFILTCTVFVIAGNWLAIGKKNLAEGKTKTWAFDTKPKF